MDKEKESTSLPFPPSVLLTRPLGAPAELEPQPVQQQASEELSSSGVSLPSLTEFIDSYVKPHMAHPYAHPSTPRSTRVPVTPPSSTPLSPLMRGSHPYEDEYPPYSPREHQSKQAYQQYMQQYHQQIRDQQIFEQREMQYREEQYRDQYLREQHMRDQQHELQEHLREQQQRLMNPYHYEQYVNEHLHRRGSLPEPPYTKVKRESAAEYQYPEHKLTVREQLKLNLLQREPSQGEPNERGYSRTPKSASTSPKHSSGFTQHMFSVPTSPISSASLSPTSYVPTTPKSASVQTQFESTKFTNYTSQEFQQQSNKSSSPSTPTPTSQGSSPSILAGSTGKWTAWENEKDVYKQAKLLSESLQSNVKSFLEATGSASSQSRATSTSSSNTPTSPALTIQRTPGSLSVPAASLSSSSPSLTVKSPRGSSSSTTSTTTKRKAEADANVASPKLQASSSSLTPAQQEYQKEAQLFTSKDVSAGMHRFNTLLNTSNLLDIYNKFQRADEYSQYYTKSHQPS